MSVVTSARGLSSARRKAGLLFDAAITVAALAGTIMLLAHGSLGGANTPRKLDALGVVLATGAALPLLGWRRHPVGALLACISFSVVIQLLGYAGGPPLGATIALYLLASSRDERRRWTSRTTATVVAAFCAHFLAYAIGHGRIPLTELAIGALVWAVAWFAGDRTRLRRAELTELRERARRAEQDAERERRLATAEERARIARDLHDSAGHAINVIAVQAGAARLLAESDPGRSHAALETIEEVARRTAAEIDQIVATLRVGDAHASGVEAPAGLAALDALVRDHTPTGLAVTLTSSGQVRRLHGAADQAAYRILQEALTNAARHGTGTAEVRLAFGAHELELTVLNPAAANGNGVQNGGGHGLIGMRERAALLGGSLAVHRANGTFEIHARLPCGER